MSSTNPLLDYIASSAISLTMAGNTGISPFLTLLLLGLVESYNPDLLNMGPTMEAILASWWSIGILAVLALGEIIGKCIPAIDEAIDSVEVFIVPVISVLASVATLGLLPGADSDLSGDDLGNGQSVDVMDMLEGLDSGYRLLQDESSEIDETSFSEGFITFTKICLVAGGILLSLAIHFFKMIVRLSSIGCSAGCCQPCITMTETVAVVIGVILAILVPVFAVIACIAFLVAAGKVATMKCCKSKDNDGGAEEPGKDRAIQNNGDEENQKVSSATEVAEKESSKAHAVVYAEAELEDVPLPPPTAFKSDVQATAY